MNGMHNKLKDFALMGNAHFIIRNKITHSVFAYKVQYTRALSNNEKVWRVSILAVKNKIRRFSIIGTISTITNLHFQIAEHSQLTNSSPAMRLFRWAWERAVNGLDIPSHIEVKQLCKTDYNRIVLRNLC